MTVSQETGNLDNTLWTGFDSAKDYGLSSFTDGRSVLELRQSLFELVEEVAPLVWYVLSVMVGNVIVDVIFVDALEECHEVAVGNQALVLLFGGQGVVRARGGSSYCTSYCSGRLSGHCVHCRAPVLIVVLCQVTIGCGHQTDCLASDHLLLEHQVLHRVVFVVGLAVDVDRHQFASIDRREGHRICFLWLRFVCRQVKH